MLKQSIFNLHQKVHVLAPGKWHLRVGTIVNITGYGTVDVMFNPWIAPQNRRGRLIPVSFKESEIEVR